MKYKWLCYICLSKERVLGCARTFVGDVNLNDCIKVSMVYDCLAPHSTIFQLYSVGQFYWFTKLKYTDKSADLPLITDKLISII